jgi:tetratricopeptide (TPR) repeat protein
MAAKRLKKPSSPLAWVGSITAVFSLIAGIYGGWSFFASRIEKRRNIDRLLSAEAVQLHTADYQAAWKTLGEAASVDPSSARVQQTQEDVAMAWLDNIRISGDETFASITDRLVPVLTRGAASDKSPQRQADLLAHLGWSYYLRSRESPSSPDPAVSYRDALQKDPQNPYAHAMWGHWMMWNHENAAQASQHFAAALASNRPGMRGFARSLQLSALNNAETTESQVEMIRVVNSIRKEHADMEARWNHDVLNLYWEYVAVPNENRAKFLSAVMPSDHLDTYDWILARAGSDEPDTLTHAYIRSALLENAGRRDEALAGYRKLQSQFARDSHGTIADDSRQAIARLTAK